MFNRLRSWIGRKAGRESAKTAMISDAEHVAAPNSDNVDSAELVPYDEYLLERSRSQWQFGDWATLAKLDVGTLRNHPDRARLVLLAASAHQNIGDMAAARRLLQLAGDWGCSRQQITRILLGDAFNTLGRATALFGNEGRAMAHFARSVQLAMPGVDGRLSAQARASQQLTQLRLQPAMRAFHPATTGDPKVASDMSKGNQGILQKPEELAQLVRNQAEEIGVLRKALVEKLDSGLSNATRQLESFVALQAYLRDGQLLPDMHGWPVSPDFGLFLIQLIESNQYDLVVEFGSGTTTLLVAEALDRVGLRSGNAARPTQVAFEHLEEFRSKSAELLSSRGKGTKTLVELARLIPYRAPDGADYDYYDCRDTLDRLAQLNAQRVLILVDGPPASTGKHARYPALPLILSAIEAPRIDVLLDDYKRPDEKEVVEKWRTYLDVQGFAYSVSERKMEKDACFLCIRRDEARA